MAAPRWAPDSAEVERAIAESSGQVQAAERLGVSHDTLRRYCRRQGIDGSAARFARQRRALQPGAADRTPEEQLEQDTLETRLRSERDHFKRMYGEATRRIAAADNVRSALEGVSVEALPAPRLSVSRRKLSGKAALPKREAILQLSDWQLGQLVTDVDTGGANEYSWEIAEKRLQRWLDAATGSIENMRHAYDVWRLVVAISGDMVEGHDVFSGQPWSLDRDAAVQALQGSALFAAALVSLATALQPIVLDIYDVPGNHGRPGGRKAGNMPPTMSFDYLFTEILKLRLANLEVNEWGSEPAGRLLFMCAGVPVLMTHGDEVRGWGGFPYYGLDKAQGRLLQELDVIFHVWLLSHWHQSAVLPSGRGQRIVNGNAVGPNRLTTAAVLGATTPSQNLVYMSRDLGVAEVAYMQLAPGELRRPTIYGGHAA